MKEHILHIIITLAFLGLAVFLLISFVNGLSILETEKTKVITEKGMDYWDTVKQIDENCILLRDSFWSDRIYCGKYIIDNENN